MPRHAPMTQFPVVDGELVVGGMPLTRLAARVGRTPFYVYDRALLSERVARLRRLRDAIRPPSADDSRATQYAFPLWDRHTHRGNELIDVTARLLTMRAVTDRELGRWEHRLESLSNQVAHLGREE